MRSAIPAPQRLRACGVGLIDCQVYSEHLASLGARNIPRQEFQRLLAEKVDLPVDCCWDVKACDSRQLKAAQ